MINITGIMPSHMLTNNLLIILTQFIGDGIKMSVIGIIFNIYMSNINKFTF